jgi:putative membrane protein
MSDPRVYFAAERTLLAWTRTGLTIMAFGFVVARFGLFLDLLAAQRTPSAAPAATSLHVSNVIGIALVLLGAVSMIFAAIQHRGYVATLPIVDLPPMHNRTFPVALALVLGFLGLALSVYLAAGH